MRKEKVDEKSLFALFHEICEQNPEQAAYRYKQNGRWHSVTWAEQKAACLRVGKSLISLGMKKGDRIAILSQTRLEWVQAELGAVGIGCVTVGIYATNLADECAYILNHSEARLLIVENAAQLTKIRSIRDRLSHLEHIVIIEGEPEEPDQAMTWQVFLKCGDVVTEQTFNERAGAVQRDDLATIIYTSGTTGEPKGAMLSHGNMLFSSWSACQCLPVTEGYETLLFLPLAHVYARMTVYACMRSRVTTAFAESIQKVAENIREIRPHFFSSAPRIYEKIYEKITAGVEDAGGLKKKIFAWALQVGYAVSRLQQQKKPVPFLLGLRHKLAAALVFKKIQAAFGGRLVCCISGAAPLNPAIAEFFHACGVLILEGIGMTENSSFTNVNRIDNFKFGTVGPPGPGIEQKVAEDGELLYRGPNVMLGYYKNPQATAEAIDAEGWLHTGDIGEIDADGFVRVTDRKKDLIITAGGKNIAPQRVERIMRTSRYISQVVAVGDRRKHLTALVTLNQPEVEAWAVANGVAYQDWPRLATHPRVVGLIESEVERLNQQLASFETIKKIRILPEDFSIDSGEMTPTLKLKRQKIIGRYADLIEEMYA